MAKALKPKTKKEELMKEVEPIEPEVVGDVEVEEDKEEAKVPVKDSREQTYSVKLDSKKIEGRNLDQVIAIVHGALGGVNKITIEQE